MKLRIIFSFVLILILNLNGANAQELKVASFNKNASALTARTHEVLDLNGEPCGLVKVGLAVPGAKFEGDIMQVEDKGGEYWIYMAGGAKRLSILTDGFLPLRYDFPEKIEKSVTYVMTVSRPDEPDVLQDVITIELNPTASGASGLPGKQRKPVKFDMVLVKTGMFKMGATPEQRGADEDEKPVHEVWLTKNFYIGETEVTQKLWEYVMGSNPSTITDNSEDLPVESISWNDAEEFCNRLSTLTGAKFRLPTEAEWEYAARGGHKASPTLFSGSDNASEVSVYNSTRPQSVKSKTPNELGIYDMSGNVWELCKDYKNDYSKGEQKDPLSTKNSGNRVRRGGAWDSQSQNDLRVAFRRRIEPKSKDRSTGLRLVLELD